MGDGSYPANRRVPILQLEGMFYFFPGSTVTKRHRFDQWSRKLRRWSSINRRRTKGTDVWHIGWKARWWRVALSVRGFSWGTLTRRLWKGDHSGAVLGRAVGAHCPRSHLVQSSMKAVFSAILNLSCSETFLPSLQKAPSETQRYQTRLLDVPL